MDEGNLKRYLIYAVGEILLVMIGILLALQVNNWNEERLIRAEEVSAISRVLADIHLDLKNFDFRINQVKAKEESLLRVKTVFTDGQSSDLHSFLNDIIVGADFGWNQGIAQRSTYDDLQGSGKLGIIENPDIRFKVTTYYRNYKDSHNRIDERETAYPHLSYQLVPRSMITHGSGEVMERKVESGLSSEQLSELVELVKESSIKDHVTAEINLARFINGITIDIQSQAMVLVKQLEEYQKEIQ